MAILSPLQNTALFDIRWIQVRPHVTQFFGQNPQMYAPFGLKGHNGTDLRARTGTKVFAPFDGKVKVKNSDKEGYGLHIRIRGLDRECVLGHLSRAIVLDGESVKTGQLIGYSGNTGFSTAEHLHFGFRHIVPERGDIFTWKVRDYGNGYFGYYNCLPYMIAFKGTLVASNL